MNVFSFEQKACERIRRSLDAYLSNELPSENRREIQQHLEKCAGCLAEFEIRERLRTRLKEAVSNEVIPAGLEDRVRRRLRSAPSVTHWFYAAAAVLLLTFGGALAVRYLNEQRSGAMLADNAAVEMQPLTEHAAQVLKIGAGDHVYCAYDHGNRERVFTLAEMTEKMGPYIELVSVAQRQAPADYKVTVAHRCHYQGREFVHLLLKNQAGNVLSVILTRKQDAESLMAGAAHQAGKIQMYQAQLQNFSVAGFETGNYLAFVISDLSDDQNRMIAASLAPEVHRFIATAQAV
ncbi:MAG TPA: zf-HC2 domain-containing protein [Blastocatellia bacterium]|nr:zf-HC2 domain-containing protein [Blastocatellia bacterium]